MLKFLFSAFICVFSGSSLAQGADAALINMVSGDVSYAPAVGNPGKVQAFMKLRDGDHVSLPAGAQVRVLFFDGARQERWSGPSSFRVGKIGTEPLSGRPVDITTLPANTPQRLAQVPDLIQLAKLGGVRVRGGLTPVQKASLEQQAAIAEARASYRKMRDEASADDITPELSLYALLYEYLLYDDMKIVAEEMLRRQPDDNDVKALVAWVRTRSSR